MTTEAAQSFATIAQKLRASGKDPRRVARFLNKLVFCLFVEDIELLPDRVFADIVEEGLKAPNDFSDMLAKLFHAMKERGQRFGQTPIPWFDGGLFEDEDVLDLDFLQIADIAKAARRDWSAIEPSIFGTLFEKGLDPARRQEMASLFEIDTAEVTREHPSLFRDSDDDHAVGVHYTDPAMIMKLVHPTVVEPLEAEWEDVKEVVRDLRDRKATARSDAARTRFENEIRDAYLRFRRRLKHFRVLDPACGSGNFLYLSLMQLKNFDQTVLEEASALGLPADNQCAGPENLLGIEINPYAAELARVTIWIGELQWQLLNAQGIRSEPILGRLDGIVCRDALLTSDHKAEASWPKANVVVGNPPFLGDKAMIRSLGEDYATALRTAFRGRVSGGADLVCYWFEKARALIEAGELERAGLVATNSIRGGANRRVLDQIASFGRIYNAWSDEPWVLDGAAVRVSLISFQGGDGACGTVLNGAQVAEIYSDLTSSSVDLTKAKRLPQNSRISFMGTTKVGAFDIPGQVARKFLQSPVNPNSRPNSDVVRPWINGAGITGRYPDMWIVDFGTSLSEGEAALYELPYQYCHLNVKKGRLKNRREVYRQYWWRHAEPRPALRKKIERLSRFIVTPRVAKHRVFVWVDKTTLPDSAVIAIARDDHASFGILHSRFHELWALRLGTSLEDRPRYTPSTTFGTFPFPEGLTPDIPATLYASDPRAKAIAVAAAELDGLRRAWLYPEDLVRWEPEVVAGFPDRPIPRGKRAEAELRKRTLTRLYNKRPQWLINAHAALDDAVAAAYGWSTDVSDDEAIERLFALNCERAAAQET